LVRYNPTQWSSPGAYLDALDAWASEHEISDHIYDRAVDSVTEVRRSEVALPLFAEA
jgi:hypothetical protein